MPYFELTSFHVQTSDHCVVDASGIIFKDTKGYNFFGEPLKGYEKHDLSKKPKLKEILIDPIVNSSMIGPNG
jgi:hypothetical protein